MMNVRYQIFVSSTFADLKDERSKVMQTIMELDCIPAGMEIFPSIDDEQFNFIKRIIDDCDYYLLIIGGRYGTVSEDGISYTEKEFDYAVTKGIKVIAFIHSSPESIPFGKSEKEESLRLKLENFKAKVSTGRLIKFWQHAEELPGLVALSLAKTIKTYPAIGWIRANSITKPEVLEELNTQRKENIELKSKIESAKKDEKLAGFDDVVEILGKHGLGGNSEWKFPITWGEVFGVISPHLLSHPADDVVKKTVTVELYKRAGLDAVYPSIDDNIFQTIKLHFKALGLINLEFSQSTGGGMRLFWALTPKGESAMIELRSVKKN